jgi:ATP-binding cassette subfamily F protein 3
VGFFAQHQLEELTNGWSPVDHLAQLMGDQTEQNIRNRLGGFGFGIDKADTPVENLSGGEKSRLLLALASFAAPHILILDEPTNHLDVDAREALIQAINTYNGAILLISHDRHLIETCADHLWLVEGSTVQPYDGNVEDYRHQALSAHNAAKAEKFSDKSNDNRIANTHHRQARKIARRSAAEARQAITGLRKAVNTAEKQLENLDFKKKELDKKLSKPELYGEDHRALNLLVREKNEMEKKITAAEEEWLIALERYDSAKPG